MLTRNQKRPRPHLCLGQRGAPDPVRANGEGLRTGSPPHGMRGSDSRGSTATSAVRERRQEQGKGAKTVEEQKVSEGGVRG